MTTHYTSCNLCEAICGLVVEVEANRIVSIRGDKDDPMSRGHICPKGVALQDLHADPERLRLPQRRRGSTWETISWEEALAECVERLGEVRSEHGRDAVGFYYGNPTGADYAATLYALLLLEALGTRNVYSANSTDGLPRMLVSLWMYGNQAVIPIPDLDRTDFLVVIGANPAVSNGSIMTAANCKKRIAAAAERGRVVVIDPRRTETAALATEHHFIRPGTDAFLLLAMLHVLEVEDPTIRRLASRFPPSLAAERTGIDAHVIVKLAKDFAAAPSAVCYGRMGACTQVYGALTTWLIDVLNIVTGNLDRPGGAMFTTPAFDLRSIAATLGQAGTFDRFRSRVSGYPEFNGELPVAALAEEITTPGEGQIRAMVIHAGNPVLSTPGGHRLDEALQSLDFMVAIDFYVNETTRHADLILPPTAGLERDHYGVLAHALAIRNATKWSPPVLDPAPDSRHGWQILLHLATGLMGLKGRPLRWLLGATGPTAALRMALRLGPHHVRFRDLVNAPHGIDLGPLEPRLPGILGTPDKQICLAPPQLVADVERLATTPPDNGLLLIGRRTLRSMNSWMHNSRRLVRGKDRCTLRLHPDDAASAGLEHGGMATVSTDGGSVRAPVHITDEMMAGVVSLPHGFGQGGAGTQQSVAAAQPGVNANELTLSYRVDPVSGTSALNGVPVDVGL